MKATKCCSRCRHKLVWTALPNGKRGQVRECQTPSYAANCRAAYEALTAPVSDDLLLLVAKACLA